MKLASHSLTSRSQFGTLLLMTAEATGKPQSTKGERTRARLLKSARELLEQDGYHDLKVTEVAPHAGLAAGVFYIYFRDKADLVLQLFDEVIERNIDHIFAGERLDDPFEAVLAANRRYVELFATGGGLNRAVGQIVDALPQARERWQAANARVAERIARAMSKAEGRRAPTEFQRFAALALQAMLDTTLLQAFTYRDPALSEMANDPERLARHLSVLWFRAAYGRDPTAAKPSEPS